MKNLTLILILVGLISEGSAFTDNQEIGTIDEKKTTELISQILVDQAEDYLSSSCITEIPRATTPIKIKKFDKYVQSILKIKDTVHLGEQMNLYRHFKITPDLVPNKTILKEDFFESIKLKAENSEKSFWEYLEVECDGGYSSIAKPIFNASYDKAVVQYGRVCGGLCGGGEISLYQLENGKWKKIKVLNYWVS